MSADATQLRNGLRQLGQRATALVGPATAANMRADPRVPVGDNPGGELRDSLTSDGQVTGGGTRFGTRVGTDKIQGATTDKGARAHPIHPKSARVLTWVGPGGRIYARRVSHPGNDPRPWFEQVMRDAYRDALPEAVRAAV